MPAEEVVYPLDDETRRRVIEIEGLIVKLGQDFLRLKAYGLADDILLQRCRKLKEVVLPAESSLRKRYERSMRRWRISK